MSIDWAPPLGTSGAGLAERYDDAVSSVVYADAPSRDSGCSVSKVYLLHPVID